MQDFAKTVDALDFYYVYYFDQLFILKVYINNRKITK